MVLSFALRNENLLSASGNTSVLVRPGLFQLLSDLCFFMHVTLLYLCFTYPCFLPFIISSSSLSALPTFKYSSISCQLAQVPHCWQRDILPSHQRTIPPNTGKLTWGGAICGAPPGTVGHVVWCCSAVAFLCSWPFADGGPSVSFSAESPAVLPLFCQFLISGATIFHVKVENELKYEDW